MLAIGVRWAWIGAVIVAAIALIWSVALLPGVLGVVSLGDLFREMEPDGGPIEEGREIGGLLIVAGWMAVLIGDSYRKERRRRPSS